MSESGEIIELQALNHQINLRAINDFLNDESNWRVLNSQEARNLRATRVQLVTFYNAYVIKSNKAKFKLVYYPEDAKRKD